MWSQNRSRSAHRSSTPESWCSHAMTPHGQLPHNCRGLDFDEQLGRTSKCWPGRECRRDRFSTSKQLTTTTFENHIIPTLINPHIHLAQYTQLTSCRNVESGLRISSINIYDVPEVSFPLDRRQTTFGMPLTDWTTEKTRLRWFDYKSYILHTHRVEL